MLRKCNNRTIASFEECCIGDDNYGLRAMTIFFYLRAVYVFLYPAPAFSIFKCQLNDGLLLICVFIPNNTLQSFLIGMILELFAVCYTPVSLSIVLYAFFPGVI